MTRLDTTTGDTPTGHAASLEERLASLDVQHRQTMELLAEMQARDALKTQFLANISHDLRTPLTAIITHAEILRDGILGPLSDRQRESIGGIINGGRQLLEMVGEILTYARGAANQLALSTSRFEIVEVIDQVVSLNESLAARKGLELRREVADDLGPIVADREKVAHVLGNLLGNAIDFTPAGGRVWVAASPVLDDGVPHLLLEVGDTGIGIAQEHHDLIFREFAQVDASAARQHHGTGLGLTIARRLVELHHGRIWLESSLGSGSRFFVLLPATPAGQ